MQEQVINRKKYIFLEHNIYKFCKSTREIQSFEGAKHHSIDTCVILLQYDARNNLILRV